MAGEEKWIPPFVAVDTEIACPACGEPDAVRVREKETVFDGDTVEAYCASCHADLEVCANVEITYSDPEVA